MNETKIWVVTAQAVYQTQSWLVAAATSQEAEDRLWAETGGMLSPISSTRHGAWMPDFTGGEYWAWAQDFRFDSEVTAAWAAAGRPYPG
jgi:hypothetical protein